MAFDRRQLGQQLTQRLVVVLVRQNRRVGVQHLRILLALVLVQLLQRRIDQHAVLTIAALHLQRHAGHRLTAPRVHQRGAVDVRRLRAEVIQALVGLIGQHQQRQQHQQKGQQHQLPQRTGK